MHGSEDVGGNVPIYGVARDPSMLGGFGTLNRRAILLGSFWGKAQRGVSCWKNVPIFVAVPECVCVCVRGRVPWQSRRGRENWTNRSNRCTDIIYRCAVLVGIDMLVVLFWWSACDCIGFTVVVT